MTRKKATKSVVMIERRSAPQKQSSRRSSTKKKSRRRGRGGQNNKNSVNPLGVLGGLAGSYLGGPAGGALGMQAGKLISQITGYGDYKVSQNTVSNGNSIPTFRQGGDGMRVAHREFLSDVTGSVAFTLNSYAIQPGLNVTFPWLSAIAVQFEEYRIDGLCFEYRPSSGSAVSSASSALGVVIMATNYDVLDATFASKQAMESYEFSTSTVPFMGCIHPVECKMGRNVMDSLFTRSTSVPTGADPRFYDLGLFQIATSGMQSGYVVGELWVSYDIVFRKPRIPVSGPGLYARLHEAAANTASATDPCGTAGFLASSDSTLPVARSGTNGIILESPGYYAVAFLGTAPTDALAQYYATPGANITLVNYLVQNSVSAVTTIQASKGVWQAVAHVTVAGTAAANALILTATGQVGGTFDAWITTLRSNLSLVLDAPLRLGGLPPASHGRPGSMVPLVDLQRPVQGIIDLPEAIRPAEGKEWGDSD